jgi:hypothetical protein
MPIPIPIIPANPAVLHPHLSHLGNLPSSPKPCGIGRSVIASCSSDCAPACSARKRDEGEGRISSVGLRRGRIGEISRVTREVWRLVSGRPALTGFDQQQQTKAKVMALHWGRAWRRTDGDGDGGGAGDGDGASSETHYSPPQELYPRPSPPHPALAPSPGLGLWQPPSLWDLSVASHPRSAILAVRSGLPTPAQSPKRRGSPRGG